jgi:hypothetical protein
MRFPPFPDIPEPLRGKAFALVEVAYAGGEAAGRVLTEPIRELGPVLDTTAMIPARELSKLHMDPPGPVPGSGDGRLLAGMDAAAVRAVVEAAGAESGSSLLSVEFRQLGGALDRSLPGDGAATFAGSSYGLFAVGIAASPEMAAKTRSDVERVVTALAPWDSGRDYMNFRESRSTGERIFSAERFARLREIKRRVDPTNLIRSNHPVVA